VAQGPKTGKRESTQRVEDWGDTGGMLSSIGKRARRVAGGQLYLKKSDGFFGGSVAGIKLWFIYAWIAENHGDTSIALCCAVLSVRREGFYDWQKRPSREQSDKR